MSWRMVGCNHRTCPLEMRERLVVSPQRAPHFLTAFRGRFPESEAVVLSTCNRLEIYTAASRPDWVPPAEATVAFLAEHQGLQVHSFADTLYHHQREQVIGHLFRVAASLDSMMLGEPQILRQVKSAYEVARRVATTGQLMHGAFQSAIRTARRVARETGIHRHHVSIPGVAVGQCATQIFEQLTNKHIVVFGAGEMAMETLRALRSAGARKVTVVNRDATRAARVADEFDAQTASWDRLPDCLIQADLIVSATSSPDVVVTLEMFRRGEAARYQRTLLILDLALPRDFDPRIADRVGVFLFSIDDLKDLGDRNRERREAEMPRAFEIIHEESQRFVTELTARKTVPVIQHLTGAAERVRDAELERLFRRLPDLDDREREEIRRTLRRVANKLLHPVVTQLKRSSDPK